MIAPGLEAVGMQYKNFDLNLLRTLDVLFVEKSVTRAAERLCISQPAMSGALQRLREHFNDQLLIRMGRDMALTPLAESLVAPLRTTLLHFQSTLQTRPSFDPSVSRRNFTLAMSDYGSFVLMPALLSRLASEAPQVECTVEPITEATINRVNNGEVDLFVTVDSCELALRQSETARDLKMRSLFDDDFVCVIDGGHPMVGEVLTRETYAVLPHVRVRLGPQLDNLVEQACRRAGLELNIAATVPSFSSTLFTLTGTRMIATVQRRLARRLASSLGLRILECPIEIRPLRQILMWHARADFDPAHQYLRRAFAESVAAGTEYVTPPSIEVESDTQPERARWLNGARGSTVNAVGG
jgi:LysR family transcriptional regulator, nod-box dependent transcriptional activator